MLLGSDTHAFSLEIKRGFNNNAKAIVSKRNHHLRMHMRIPKQEYFAAKENCLTLSLIAALTMGTRKGRDRKSENIVCSFILRQILILCEK